MVPSGAVTDLPVVEKDRRTVGRVEDILPCVRLGGGAEIAGDGQDVGEWYPAGYTVRSGRSGDC